MSAAGDAPRLVAGVDEVGRGPLAGPVVAAAVVLPPDAVLPGLRDSKRLSPRQRAGLETRIKSLALAYAIAEASVEEIDAINILRASLLAMRRAVDALGVRPGLVLVDGNTLPDLELPARAIVGGDDTEPAISAASVLAKEHRDRLMRAIDSEFPGYGFAGHMGYPTRAHLDALARLGPCIVHRRSFAPVRALLVDADRLSTAPSPTQDAQPPFPTPRQPPHRRRDR